MYSVQFVQGAPMPVTVIDFDSVSGCFAVSMTVRATVNVPPAPYA
jgi:hypothetical protein